MIGETVRHYRILDRLGAGGMGEVYRALDERLGREVALKVLPEELATDPDRLRRLETEARALAAVDHPNVVTIHSVEEHRGRVLLVMELVEGETLSDRLDRGPLPVDEALELARQIALGLEAAHGRGIVHRDLKPGNVMVEPGGRARILDFGIAKALVPLEAGRTDPDATLPRDAEAVTREGQVLGTAPYLSPEQARGREVDERTDVWAFGCLLYQMLTARRAFDGDTLADVVAAILEQEPDWEALPPATPRAARWVLRRCLERNPEDRLHAIADARLMLEGLDDLEPVRGSPEADREGLDLRSRRTVVGSVAAAGAVILGWLLLAPAPEAPTDPSIVRFSLFADPEDPEVGFRSLQLSPDGRQFAYQTAPRPNATRSAIQVRSLESGAVQALPGTEGARDFVFTSDGRAIVYLARETNAFRRVDLRDGSVTTLASSVSANRIIGMDWTDEGHLVFATMVPRGLWRVPGTGGRPERIEHDDPGTVGRTVPIFPGDLPGPRSLLYTRWLLPRDFRMELLSTETGRRKPLTDRGSGGRFVAPDLVVFHEQGKLFAVPFDPDEGRTRGEPVAVLDSVQPASYGTGLFATSRSGSLVYVPAGSEPPVASLAAAAPGGDTTELLPRGFAGLLGPRVSPDGKRVVASSSTDSERASLWLFDLERGTARRATGEEGDEWWSAWGPDGRLAFQSNREDGSFLDLYLMDPDRPGSARKVLDGGTCHLQPQAWTPGGRLLYQRSCPTSGTLDIHLLDVGTGETLPLRAGEAREKHPSVSPDGRWLVFASDLSGEDQVYLTTYPEPGRLLQVSPAGGDAPHWTSSGDGVLFHRGGTLFFVPFDPDAPQRLGEPEVAVARLSGSPDWGRNYDLLPDGRIVFRTGGTGHFREVRVVLGWNREVAARLEADRPGD